jgi:membrane protein required for colicin V production
MNFEVSQIVITVVVVCLFLWRISYGASNGLFAEAAGLIAAIAAFAGVYYTMNIAGSILSSKFGAVLPKVGYLVVAVIIYSVMTAIGKAFRKVKEIPILGGIDRLLGAVLGAAEAYAIVYIVQYVTEMDFFAPVVAVGSWLFEYLKTIFQELIKK